jgi:hypothetical protein
MLTKVGGSETLSCLRILFRPRILLPPASGTSLVGEEGACVRAKASRVAAFTCFLSLKTLMRNNQRSRSAKKLAKSSPHNRQADSESRAYT